MPIIFEQRLGHSESDRKVRAILRTYNILWLIYYSFIIVGSGWGIAILALINGYFLLALPIMIVTIAVLVIFLRWQTQRRRRTVKRLPHR
jgi:TRAP-type C4-dicarboxylate transport system permease small subunit